MNLSNTVVVVRVVLSEDVQLNWAIKKLTSVSLIASIASVLRKSRRPSGSFLKTS